MKLDNIQVFWKKFITEFPEAKKEPYAAWSFGATAKEADEILPLVLQGIKTATTSAYELYKIDKEPLPKAEEYSILLDSKGNPHCVIKTTQVTIVPLNEITSSYAFKEGEGDRTLAYWQEIHETFFKKSMKKNGCAFSKNMLVVCEEFELLYP